MRHRQKILSVTAVLAAACSSGGGTAKPPPGATSPPSAGGSRAIALGMSVLSADDRGKPRILRAVARKPARAGLAAGGAAGDHLAALEPLWLEGQTAADRTVTATNVVRGGAQIVSFTQSLDGVDIHGGQIRVLLGADGSLSAVSGSLVARPASKAIFHLTPEEAAARALEELLTTKIDARAMKRGATRAGFQSLTVPPHPRAELRSTRAKQEYFAEGGRLVPAWSVEVIGKHLGYHRGEPLAKRVHIADADGRVLRTANLAFSDAFVYRVYADRRAGKRPFDGPVMSYLPHPSGVPDGFFPGFASSNLVAMEAFNQTRDPWLPGDARTTTGNNVVAFADLLGNGRVSEGNPMPEVTFGRLLNYPYNPELEPLATAEQSKASATSMFYVTNWLHDWYYDSGFTEAAGNAQANNLGRGGSEGDPLLAMAQSDPFGSRDNAFAAVPSDGESPELHMFLWDTGDDVPPAVTLACGTVIEGTFLIGGQRNFDITRQVVTAHDAPAPACAPITKDVRDKLVLVDLPRQEELGPACAPADPVSAAQRAGAAGVIARAPDADLFPIPGVTSIGPGATLPFIAVSPADADTLRAQVATGHTVRIRRKASNVEQDGSLDNAIVAHEWGHYLHLRLTSTCETNQCGAMSEGWADFVALHLLLRPEDNRAGTFGAGAYALNHIVPDAAYFGIRRFPYSTDRSKNDLSFRHIAEGVPLPTGMPISTADPDTQNGIGNSEVHSAGEVWTSMLWDAYNALLDDRGYDRGRRLMSDYIVAGMMLQPPDPTFTETRDAILAAAGAMDEDDMLVLAAAMAGRGAGTCAVSPPRDSLDHVGVVENRTVSGRLELSAPELTDDGASCDHDGYLDPGESGTLQLTVANSGPDALAAVVLTPSTTSTGVTVGDPILVGDLEPFQSVEIAIPVQVAADAPPNTDLDVAVDAQADGGCGCTSGGLSVAVHQRLGVDEQPNRSASDDVEAQRSLWTRPDSDSDLVWNRVAIADHDHVWRANDKYLGQDTQLVSPVLQASATQPFIAIWDQRYRLAQDSADLLAGAVVEVSTDGGAIWTDVSMLGVDPGYTGTVSDCCLNALAGQHAYAGTSAGYPGFAPIRLDFGMRFAGKPVQLRFRSGGFFLPLGDGWDIDNIRFAGITNQPFTAITPETQVCSASSALRTATVRPNERAPRASLRGVPLPAELDE